jgi:hypothetical protein
MILLVKNIEYLMKNKICLIKKVYIYIEINDKITSTSRLVSNIFISFERY